MNNQQAVWSVSALNFEIKTMLEKGIGSIWIEGEISNFARPASGHWYFSLKDDRAQLRAAMFKNRNARIPFTPQNGQQVLVRAQVTLYEARGDFQIIIEHMEEAGAGLLMRQYEELKKKLSSEGLFAAEQKKPVPGRASHIGIVTSASGAAIRDVLSVIRRRSPLTQVSLFATPVQGEAATPQIINAIQQANRSGLCDVLLLVRGGGSLEDLWCFNDEAVARAIHASTCPVVTGIGHEIDFTIADFVADQRAPTPSVAAETVTMDQYEMMATVDQLQARLLRGMEQRKTLSSNQLQKLSQRLLGLHPQRQLAALGQRLLFAQSRLQSLETSQLNAHRAQLQLLVEKTRQHHPQFKVRQLSVTLNNLLHQLTISATSAVKQSQHRFTLQARSLDNLSPLKTLARGYAAVSHEQAIISSAQQLSAGDIIDIRFKDGSNKAKVLP